MKLLKVALVVWAAACSSWSQYILNDTRNYIVAKLGERRSGAVLKYRGILVEEDIWL